MYIRLLVLAITSILIQSPLICRAQEMPEETPAQKRMAQQMAKQMDVVWDQEPKEGANIRLLVTKDGNPLAGKISIYTDFVFRADSRSHHSQGFNPNENGRWVFEGLDPGTYTLTVEGRNSYEGWSWQKDAVTVKEGEVLLFEVEAGK